MADNIVDIYLFETVERLSRFFIHLEDLDKQFYSNEKNILRDKGAFIQSYEQCLEKLIEIIIALDGKDMRTKKVKDKVLKELESVNITIKNLQSKLLVHLPRPTEPVELRRFCRVIQKQIIKLDEKNKDRISIYVNENAEDNTYASDPLEIFKQDEINSLISSVSKLKSKNDIGISLKQLNFKKNSKNNTTIHISVPRIEANNPCHWPTLIHEVSHNLMKKEWFNGEGIHNDFLKFLKKSFVRNGEGLNDILPAINLNSWLIECWCDLFACALIGPSFYFSQYSAFIHTLEFNDNKRYPPNLFRLKLIQKFLEHRFKNLVDDKSFSKMIVECEALVVHLDNKNNNLLFHVDSELSNLFVLFNQYFLHEFFILENGLLNFKSKELSTLFDNISSFVNKFELTKINDLAKSLNEGLPISSYRVPSDKNPLFEKPNYVQEIFLASWIYRNTSFRKKIIEAFKNIHKSEIKGSITKVFKDCIVKEFLRLDHSILRSIQISEWVDLFVDNDPHLENLGTVYASKPTSKTPSGLLVDRDIYQYLSNNVIRVMPLININKQLGSTSLDIRLGTSFDVFFPNQFGIVDFTDSDTTHNIKYNSKKINLDYIEHIPINPGQFMLGHSMEYIKLPDQISADLEGRSSFARLGIEIHMTAGFVDPGFEGVLTFEIFNAGTNPVMLYPGLRIGQLRFMTVAEPSLGYAKRRKPKYSGRLEHHFSLHGDDYEVERISDERKKLERIGK